MSSWHVCQNEAIFTRLIFLFFMVVSFLKFHRAIVAWGFVRDWKNIVAISNIICLFINRNNKPVIIFPEILLWITFPIPCRVRWSWLMPTTDPRLKLENNCNNNLMWTVNLETSSSVHRRSSASTTWSV